LGWLLLHSVSDPKQAYVTATGDQQSIKLRDGSLVQLNTHSRIEATYSAGARQVRLLEGEALFIVAQDPARPFRVYTDSATIQAIGTQFNVYRRVNGTRVSVVEGIVQVSRPAAAPVRLEAGAEADIAADRVTRTAKPDVDRAVAWRARRLVFHSDRLEDVAREFNRYNRDQIRLDGVGVADRRISGVFDADDTQPLIEFLNAQPGFSVTQAGRETVIRVR
jgi:transmembrane sensor